MGNEVFQELRRLYHDGIRLVSAKIILADKYRYAKQTRYPFTRQYPV